MPIHQDNRPALPMPQQALDELPVAIEVYWTDGVMATRNHQQNLLTGIAPETVIGTYNVLQDEQNIANGFPEAFERLINGGEQTILLPLAFYDTEVSGLDRVENRRIWFEATLFAIHAADGTTTHIAGMYRNVTDEVTQREELEQMRQQVEMQRAEFAAAQEALDSQQETIYELSSPVIQVWEGVLTVPVVGVVDSRRATTITESLLEAIVHYQAGNVIIDITGVAMVDTQVANYLLMTARACRLLGSEVALVGVGSEIAQTIVQLGVDLSDLTTRANLRDGIAWALERQGLHVTHQ